MTATIFFHAEEGNRDLIPRKQHPDDAAYDLCAAADMVIAPGSFAAVPTGIFLEMPSNFAAQVRPRSGLALKFGVTVLNSPGTVDAGYRGEVRVVLINHGAAAFPVHRGDRIAQLLFEELPAVELVEKAELSESARGTGGFGSTGRR